MEPSKAKFPYALTLIGPRGLRNGPREVPAESNAGRSFAPDALAFLAELAKHNNREWFTKNKTRYEQTVRDPALRFVREVAPKLGRISPRLVADPRPVGGSVSRIYRDIRFSKDKSPYKTSVGIGFAHEAAHSHEGGFPGIYLHLTPGNSMVAGGAWRPEPKDLARIRQAIVVRPKEWAKVGRAGIEVGGEALQRVPPGFDRDHEFAEDLKRKDFVASTALSDREVTSPRFQGRFLDVAQSFDPLNGFLASALGVPW